MKRLVRLLSASLVLLLGSAVALAQQPRRLIFRVTDYFNVTPDKADAMIDEARTSGRKLMQERIASGENITSWVVLRLVYSGIEPAIPYNYAISVNFDGVPQAPNAATRDQVYRKATGMSFQDYTQKTSSLRTSIGSVLYEVDHTAPGSQTKDGNYVNVTRWKFTAGRGPDYGAYVANFVLPLNAQAVKEGRSLGWSASRVFSPGGGNMSFVAVLTNTVKDFSGALPSAAPGPELAQTRFTQLFPRQSFATFTDQGTALRTLIRSEIFEVIAAGERPGGPSASK